MPSAPRLLRTKSLTSRPRSPTSPTTFTSACEERQIMPSSELLPTPAPAKMPRRWPTPSVSMLSTARTPVENTSATGLRPNAGGGARWIG
jgi:hypothetical protein